jgi:hypothetical protein
MMDLAAQRLSAWMEVEGHDRKDFAVRVTDQPGSPWLLVSFTWVIAYDAALPASYDFAVWRETGAVHRSIDGEVQDPELFHLVS